MAEPESALVTWLKRFDTTEIEAGRMALDAVDDSLTFEGAVASAALRRAEHPGWTADEIARDIARHYTPRRRPVQLGLF